MKIELERKSIVVEMLFVFLAILEMQNFLFAPHAENLAYSEFKALLKAGLVVPPFATIFAGIAARISIALYQFRVRCTVEDRNGGARP